MSLSELRFRSMTMNEKATQPLIAVVDDDQSVGCSLARFLKASGFQSVHFRSAEIFLADLQRPRFDCLIVDLQLDGMSGMDLREQLESAGENIPIIFVTARDEDEVNRLALQVPGSTFLRKSDPGEAILAALGRAIHQYRNPEQGGRRDGGNCRC